MQHVSRLLEPMGRCRPPRYACDSAMTGIPDAGASRRTSGVRAGTVRNLGALLALLAMLFGVVDPGASTPPPERPWYRDWIGLGDNPDPPTVRAYIKMYEDEPHAAEWVTYAEELLARLTKPPPPPPPDPPRLLAGSLWKSPRGMEFVWIPAGTFMMGSPEGERARDDDEVQHEVRISRGFWMGKYEVTQGEWEAVMGWNPSSFEGCGVRCPVESVFRHHVQEFIGKLNEWESGSGYEYRLPTEAEWEYAARAGSAGATPEGELRILGERNAPGLDGQAWYGGNSGVTYAGAWDCSWWKERQYEAERCGTHAVGLKRANGWGLHDMLGNVWELTADWYGRYPSGSVTDPEGSLTGSLWVVRGGCWSCGAREVRSANRIPYTHNSTWHRLGFRLVRTE